MTLVRKSWNRSPFLSPEKKRQAVCVENHEGMSSEGTLVKAPLASRRKIMPPTPQQSSQSSIEAMQLQTGALAKRQL